MHSYAATNTWDGATKAVHPDKHDQLQACIEFDGRGLHPPDGLIDPDQKEYIGRMTRITMGDGTDKRRCVKKGIKGVMFVDPAKLEGLNKEMVKAYQVVRDMDQESVVPKEVYEKLPGFTAKIVWGLQL
ncbi:hypothetical protein ABW19_dt0206476 [Dactylella cylindrospora]|nr:hypothetical protein ABW19_dt0206476 [Dactylella cylindrospora]